MSDQVKALKDQMVALIMDCHYLISLLNTTDNIDWDNWPEGRKIKNDLEAAEALVREQSPDTEIPIRRNVKQKVEESAPQRHVRSVTGPHFDAVVTPSFPKELLEMFGLH